MTKWNFIASAIVVFGVLAIESCTESKSKIVTKAESAGSGDLTLVSKSAMLSWLGKHDDVAAEIDQMCVPVREKATAGWSETTEGRLCRAAHECASSLHQKVTGDGRVFWPGAHPADK